MKNKIWITLLCMLSSHLAYVHAAQAIEQKTTAEKQTIILKKLDFKNVFMQFYQKRIRHIQMNQSSENAVGLVNSSGDIQYAVFNPVQRFKNVAGENRYIVWVELFDQENGEIIAGHPSRPKVELYLFKQNDDGHYQLLSQTRPKLDVSGSWGESHLQASDFQRIQKVGKNQMGLLYSGGYTSTGSHTESEFLIVFNEQGWIEEYPFGISENNSGAHEEDDPEYGGYSKTYTLLKNQQASSLFPIKIEYTQYGKMDWVDNFPKNGTVEVVHFDTKKNCYINAKAKCNSDFSE